MNDGGPLSEPAAEPVFQPTEADQRRLDRLVSHYRRGGYMDDEFLQERVRLYVDICNTWPRTDNTPERREALLAWLGLTIVPAGVMPSIYRSDLHDGLYRMGASGLTPFATWPEAYPDAHTREFPVTLAMDEEFNALVRLTNRTTREVDGRTLIDYEGYYHFPGYHGGLGIVVNPAHPDRGTAYVKVYANWDDPAWKTAQYEYPVSEFANTWDLEELQ